MYSLAGPESLIKAYKDKFLETAAGTFGNSASKSDDPFIVTDKYTGPRIADDSKITIEDIKRMIVYFKKEKKPIHFRYAVKIILDAFEVLRDLPNVVDVRINPNERLTVVGDIHGQFYDLINLFEINGYPSPTNMYLFNGDYVDRGPNSCEVVLTLYAFKALYPSYIHLARGNHESRSLNLIYGFYNEVREKYGNKLIELFRESFKFLPLAHIVQDSVFVVHAGLHAGRAMEPITISDIQNVNRKIEIPNNDGGILCNMTWADPQERPGRTRSKRGVSAFNFGPDVTQRFLEKNGFRYVIRSHEVKTCGYEWAHDGRLITLFSAPNYGGILKNDGAYIHITASSSDPEIVTFREYNYYLSQSVARSPSPVAFPFRGMMVEQQPLPPLSEKYEAGTPACMELEKIYMDCEIVSAVRVFLANKQCHTIIAAAPISPPTGSLSKEKEEEEVKQRILEEMVKIGRKRQLHRHQRPVSLILLSPGESPAGCELRLGPLIEEEAERLQKVMNLKRVGIHPDFDYISYKFVCYQESLTNELNELYAKAMEIAMKLRVDGPASTLRLKEAEVAVAQRLAAAREAGRNTLSAIVAKATEATFGASPLSLVAEFVRSFGTYKAEIVKLNEELQTAQTATDPEIDAAIENYRTLVENIRERANNFDEPVPYQITSGLVLNNGSRSSAGCLAECVSVSSWKVSCALCGDLIECGSHGKGTPRYKCIMCSAAPSICVPCYDAITTLLEACRKRGVYSQGCDRIYSITGCFAAGHSFVREVRHPIWTRQMLFPTNPAAVSPATLLARAAEEFADRPFIGVNSQSDIMKKSTGLHLLDSAAAGSISASSVESPPPEEITSPRSMMASNRAVSSPNAPGSHALRIGNAWWYKYRDVYKTACTLAQGLKEIEIPPRSIVCCYMRNSVEHVLVQFACAVGGYVFCGLYDTMIEEDVYMKLAKFESPIIFCDSMSSKKLLAKYNPDAQNSKLRHIVVVNPEKDLGMIVESPSSERPLVLSLSDLIATTTTTTSTLSQVPSSNNNSSSLPECPSNDELFSIWVTPNNFNDIVITASNLYENVKSTPYFEEPYTQIFTRSMSYSSEILRLWDTLSNGGKVGIPTGPSYMSENDFYVIRPTHLCLTKEFWEESLKRRRSEITYAKSHYDKVELIESIFGESIRVVYVDYSKGAIQRSLITPVETLFKGEKPVLHTIFRTCETGIIAIDDVKVSPKTMVKTYGSENARGCGIDNLDKVLLVRTIGMPTKYYNPDIPTSLSFIKDKDTGAIFFNTGVKGLVNSKGQISILN